MRRKPPTFEPPDIKVQSNTMIVQERSYRLLTPLFGGGVEPQKPDPITTVRATSIRGHLRFWWRATRGGNYSSLEELHTHEQAIWGGPARFEGEKLVGGRSRVVVELISTSTPQPVPVFRIEEDRKQGGTYNVNHISRSNVPAYVAFPLQPPRDKTYRDTVINPVNSGVTFTIKLRFDKEIRDDVLMALRAWEMFGGVGGRTRRGFGAVDLQSVDGEPTNKPLSTPEAVQHWIQDLLKSCTGTWPDNVPHLSPDSSFHVLTIASKREIAWSALVDKLKLFRSQIDVPPFRKREMDEIARAIVGGRDISISKFQRAALGLPIVYSNLKRMPSGVTKVTLQGLKKHSRYASPLLLRPIACQGEQFAAVFVALKNTRPPHELELTGLSKKVTVDGSAKLNTLQDFFAMLNQDDEE